MEHHFVLLRVLVKSQSKCVKDNHEEDEGFEVLVHYYFVADLHNRVLIVLLIVVFNWPLRLKELLDEGVFSLEHACCSSLDLDAILFDKELCELRWQFDLDSYLL
jgi:hypothetical protein